MVKQPSPTIKDYTLKTLVDLVSIPTINPPGLNYKECSQYLAGKLEDLGLKVDVIEIPEEYVREYYPYTPQHRGHPRFIVYGRIGRGKPTLHFNGHYDVVPPGTGWSREPFKPLVENGRVYGRGATDMKGGIACILGAIKQVLEVEGKELSGLLEVAFVPDEEAGGLGTRYLVEELKCRPDYVIIGEPTTAKRVIVGHKGMIRGLIRVFGRQVHGSVPWLGENAFIKAAALTLKFIQLYQPILNSRKTHAPVSKEEYRYPTVNLGGYAESTSKKDNVVPGEFILSFDRRVIPEEELEDVIAEFKEKLYEAAEITSAKLSLEIKSAVPPSLTPLDSKIVRVAVEAVKELFSIEPTVEITTGRNDAVYYTGAGKSQVINLGPGVEWTAHTPNEYNEISELEGVIALYTRIMEKLIIRE